MAVEIGRGFSLRRHLGRGLQDRRLQRSRFSGIERDLQPGIEQHDPVVATEPDEPPDDVAQLRCADRNPPRRVIPQTAGEQSECGAILGQDLGVGDPSGKPAVETSLVRSSPDFELLLTALDGGRPLPGHVAQEEVQTHPCQRGRAQTVQAERPE